MDWKFPVRRYVEKKRYKLPEKGSATMVITRDANEFCDKCRKKLDEGYKEEQLQLTAFFFWFALIFFSLIIINRL